MNLILLNQTSGLLTNYITGHSQFVNIIYDFINLQISDNKKHLYIPRNTYIQKPYDNKPIMFANTCEFIIEKYYTIDHNIEFGEDRRPILLTPAIIDPTTEHTTNRKLLPVGLPNIEFEPIYNNGKIVRPQFSFFDSTRYYLCFNLVVKTQSILDGRPEIFYILPNVANTRFDAVSFGKTGLNEYLYLGVIQYLYTRKYQGIRSYFKYEGVLPVVGSRFDRSIIQQLDVYT